MASGGNLPSLDLQCTPEGRAHHHHHDCEWEAHDNGDGLQRGEGAEAPRRECRDGNCTLRHRPEDALHDVRLATICGNQVHHQRATVAGRHEVEDGGDDGHEDQAVSHAIVLAHQVEPIPGGVTRRELADGAHIRVNGVAAVSISWQARWHVEALACPAGPEGEVGVEEVVGVAVQFRANILQPDGPAVHADGGCAEDAEPQHGVQEGQGQGVQDHLLDGTSSRDAGHERAHKRGPSDPPAPVKDGPPVHPGRMGSLAVVGPAVAEVQLSKGVGVKGELYEVRKVVADRLHDDVEDVPRLIQAEDDHHEEVAEHEGRVGDSLDSKVQASHHRGGGEQRDDGDQPGSRVGELVLQASAKLQGTLNGHVNLPGTVPLGLRCCWGWEAHCAVLGEGSLKPLKPLHATDNLAGAQAKGRAEPGDDGDDGQDVQQVTHPAPSGLAKERGHAGAEAQRQVLPVGEEAHGQRSDGVHDPCQEAPVEERDVKSTDGPVVLVEVPVVVCTCWCHPQHGTEAPRLRRRSGRWPHHRTRPSPSR